MKNILPILLLVLLLACSPDEQPKTDNSIPPATVDQAPTNHPAFQSILPTQAIRLIGEKPDLLIVDVRTAREISQNGALPNSVKGDIGIIVKNGVTSDKSRPVLVVCAVGGRSYAVGKLLVQKGYSEIYNLSGGISRWKREGLHVVYPGR